MEKRLFEVEFRAFQILNKPNFTITYLISSFVFPQFGPWSNPGPTFGPNHGFARIVRWTLERGPERLPNGDIEAVLSLMDTDFTRSMWNYP